MAPLTGQMIALAEGRQLEELAQMLEKEGATTVRCPMVSILDAPDEGPVVAWLRRLINPGNDYVIFSQEKESAGCLHLPSERIFGRNIFQHWGKARC